MHTHPDLQRHIGKFYGKYSGSVVRNEDPDSTGRIEVQVPSVFGAELVVWARPCLPFGHFFVPAVGTPVWIEFEGGDPQFPLWVGAWYPAGAAPDVAAINPPDNRVIRTPSGHTIEIMDQEGEERIIIRHKGNAFLVLDKSGNVVLSNQSGSHLNLDVSNGVATLMSEQGHLVTLKSDGVTLASSGGAYINLNDNEVQIVASKIHLLGDTVALGTGAAEPTLMATTFWTIFASHMHATGVGPSGPPMPPVLPTLVGPPATSAVVVK